MKIEQIITHIMQSRVLRGYESARVTHLPTGIATEVSLHRRVQDNIAAALRLMFAKLVDLKSAKPFVPTLVRTYDLSHSAVLDFNGDVVSSDPQRVLDGDLDPIIDASYGGTDDIL